MAQALFETGERLRTAHSLQQADVSLRPVSVRNDTCRHDDPDKRFVAPVPLNLSQVVKEVSFDSADVAVCRRERATVLE